MVDKRLTKVQRINSPQVDKTASGCKPIVNRELSNKNNQNLTLMNEKDLESYEGNKADDMPDTARYEDEEYLTEYREKFLSDYGPASERTQRVWFSMCQRWGYEFVARVEKLDDLGMKRRLGILTFGQALKEKFRQQRLAKLKGE